MLLGAFASSRMQVVLRKLVQSRALMANGYVIAGMLLILRLSDERTEI